MENKKNPTTLVAFLPIIFMTIMVLYGNIVLGVKIEFVLILASLFAGIVAYKLGYTWNEMMNAYTKKVAKAFPAILILIAIGGLVGTWMYSGTVPMMVYYGLKLLHPRFIVVTAFIVTAIVSTFTGTSWGSAATSGVAFMSIADSMGIPLPIVAGAIISGAFLGDKVSPVSDTTNLNALAAEISVYDHIKGMLPNVITSGVLAIIAFICVGMFYYNGNSQLSEMTIKIIEDLGSIYNFNIWMLLPPIIVFGGGYFGFSALILMLISSVVAIFVGWLTNDFSFVDGAASLITGFNIDMSHLVNEDIIKITPKILGLLNRGGFMSMMSAVLFCFLAMPFGSFMEVSGCLDKIVENLTKIVKGAYSLIIVTFVTGATINGVTSNGQFSILTTGQLFKDSFVKKHIPLNVLSRNMENSMTLFECFLPWHVTAIYMSTTLGVPTTEYVKWSFFNILGIFLYFILSYPIAKKCDKLYKEKLDVYEEMKKTRLNLDDIN